MSDDNPSPSPNPNRPRRDDSIPLSVWTRIDEICDRFEQAWNAEESPKLDDYLVSDLPANQLRALFAFLLTVELDGRRAAGQEPTVQEYHQRFADFVAEVDQCFDSVSATIDPTTGMRLRHPQPTASRWVGPYKLLQQIGEGGMGTVWMAEQEKPVRRRVALKLIKSGQDSRQVIARFEAERQALAMMDHQNIAKVLDAGTTDDGLPFFVMELVQGEPITAYCDRNKLTPRERLDLFIPVCKAIQHAHQKGIIHRDLKPSNVLVQIYDGKPMAKVIDFGLAKALQHQTKLTDKTVFTEFGQVVGTVQYMSPEQARLDAVDIDTRTDIYSLGVMLYELLTGSTPLDKETAKKQALLQVLQIIREQEPPRPSQRLSSSGHKISEISKQRSIEPHQLQKILRGDLDWIIMKSLEKDRVRRYATANDFAEDVQRYIQGDAVEARPPTTAYRVSKFVRKNRGLVVTTVTIMALLLAGIAAISWFAVGANRATTTAKAALEREEQQRKRVDAEAEQARLAQAETAAEQRRTKQALEESEALRARSNYLFANDLWNENRIAKATALLDSIPPQQRNFEWYRDRRRFLGSDVTCYGHQDGVTSVAFSPDGRRIVSASNDRTLKLWDARTGAEIQTLARSRNYVVSVAFSPDGSRIVSGGSRLQLWDARTGAEIQTLKGHLDWITSVAFSPDGSCIASGSHDATVRLWDARNLTELQTLAGRPGLITSVAFSPDGSRIASAHVAGKFIGGHTDHYKDSTLRLWDARSGEEIQAFAEHTDWVTSVAFSPGESRIVSGSRSGTLRLWDARTGTEIQTLEGYGGVNSVAFSPDGSRIISGGARLQLWDARSGDQIQMLAGHTDSVSCVAFNPDGSRIVSGSEDKTLKLWDAPRSAEFQTLTGPTGLVGSVWFSPDGTRVCSKSRDGQEKFVWEVKTRKRLGNDRWEDLPALSTSTDGRWLAVPSDKNVLLVDREFKSQPDEKAYRESKARLDPFWHMEQAELAEQAKDWYSATFHWAWALSAKPDHAGRYYRFHSMHQRLIKKYGDEKIPLDNDLVPIVSQMLALSLGNDMSEPDASQLHYEISHMLQQPDNKEIGELELEILRLICEKYPQRNYLHTLADTQCRLGHFEAANTASQAVIVEFARELTVHPTQAFAAYRFHRALDTCVGEISEEEAQSLRSHPLVQQALRLRVGDELDENEARLINNEIWAEHSARVAKPTEIDFELMRSVCNNCPTESYWETLALVSYRMDKFQDAVDAIAKLQLIQSSLLAGPFDKRKIGGDYSPQPIDLAILAMSHLRMGNAEKANELRSQLNHVMKIDRWRADQKSNVFLAEVNRLFSDPDNSNYLEKKASEVAMPEGQE